MPSGRGHKLSAEFRRKIPKTLKLRGRTWRIQVSSTLRKKEGVVGLTVYCDRTIRMDSTVSEEEFLVTLAHEMVHAVFPYNIVGARTEERLIEAMEDDFKDLLRDNLAKLAELFGKK